MATFLNTVLALLPVFFYRMDETSGTVMGDSSGNNFHGTYFPEAVLGRPSPVETDAGSSAVQGAAGSRVISDPQEDFRDNSTWIVFGYLTIDDANDNNVLFCRSGQIGLGLSNYIAFNNGNIEVQYTCGGVNHVLNYAVSNLVRGTWYYIRVTRNGVQLTLHVNEVLVAPPITTLSGPMDITWLSDGWYFGRSQSANAWHSTGTDEAIGFDYALTDLQALPVYESALNSLSLAGYSNVISSAILYSDVEPEPISFPYYRHNWGDPLIERISFTTGVSTAVRGYESNVGQRVKPRREIEITQVTKNDTERRMLRAKLNAHQNRKWLIPMLGDRERLTTSISAGATTITTDTLYKDYEIGGRVGIRQLNDAGVITASEELLIGNLTDTDITTSTPTINSYTNPEVYPIRRAILDASITPRGHTDSVEEVTILARLIAEDEKSIPHRIVPWTPATTYKTYEVFPFAQWPNDWSELRDYAIDRAREDVDRELGSFTAASDTTAASEAFSWRIILDTKQKQAEFLGWFYARAGSLNYLWVPTMQRDFEVVSALGDDLTVVGHNYSENFSGSEFRRDLSFTYNDNSAILRRIEGVSLSGANEILDLDNNVPTLTNLRSISCLLFCRLDNDTIERACETDTKARFAWMFREMLVSPD